MWKGVNRAYNADNQETARSQPLAYAYDGAGNTTQMKKLQPRFAHNAPAPTQKLVYNAQGRLAELRDAGNALIASYVYRGDGKRAWKELANGERTYFYYLGEQLTATSDGVIKFEPGAVGRRWSSCRHAQRQRCHANPHQASTFSTTPRAISPKHSNGANGNVVSSQSAVSAWGEPLRDNAGNQSGGGYGAKFGYLRDSESGFYLCTLRYYDPSAGRWLTRDPIGYAGGSNLYGYAGNDPVNMSDPSGLAPAMWDMGTAGGGAQALIGVGDTYVHGTWLQDHTGYSRYQNSPTGSFGAKVEEEINAATKYLQGMGYHVIVERNITWQRFAEIGKRPDVSAFFFIGHADPTSGSPNFFLGNGDVGHLEPKQYVELLGGKKFDWVTLHSCDGNQQTLKDVLLSPHGKWWASNGTYDPDQHKDMAPVYKADNYWRWSMAQLRKVIYWITAAGIVIPLFLWFALRVMPPKPTYSSTPDEAMQRLEKAVLKGDTRQISSLFSNNEAWGEFMNVPINSLISKESPVALKRSASQSSLEAWQKWFSLYGRPHLKYGPSANHIGIRCSSSDGSFDFGLKLENQGYIIYYCGYAV